MNNKKIVQKTSSKSTSQEEILAVLKNNLDGITADGGGIEIVNVDKKKGVVEIRMTGSCCGCPFKQLTFAKNVAEKLKGKISWVKDVKLVE